jgi:putative spermidine/putrescine transport system permease protein
MTGKSNYSVLAALILPALALFLLFLVAPLTMMGDLSFRSFDPITRSITGTTFANYTTVLTDSYYLEIFGRTLLISITTTLVCLVLGIPEAFIIFRMSPRWRTFFLLLTLTPLLISVIVRTLGWVLLFGRNGVINTVLVGLGIVDRPVALLYTSVAVVVALAHIALPFMIISIWTSLQRINPQVLHAATSLGAGQFQIMTRIVIPQIIPGMISGSLIVFALAASAFATPAIIGGRQVKVVATTAYDEFLGTLNWPLGAAIAVTLLIVNIAVMMTASRLAENYNRKVTM